MNLSDLKICDYLAQERHFGRAAARANLTQPAVSLALKRVERHYGVRLFERGQGSVALTEAGERMLPIIRSMLDRAELLRQAATGGYAVGNEPLRVGYTPWTRSHVRQFVAEIRTAHLGVEVHLQPAPIPAQRRMLADGALDVACLPDSSQHLDCPGRVVTLELSALASSRSWYRSGSVLVPDLEDMFIAGRIRELLAAGGIAEAVRPVASPEELVDRVLAGEGTALVDPRVLPAALRASLAIRRLDTSGVVVTHKFHTGPNRCELLGIVEAMNGAEEDSRSVTRIQPPLANARMTAQPTG